VTTRLILDEMFHPRIAEELSARGHDCLAVVAEADLRRSSDEDLLQRAAAEPVPPLIDTSDAAFPRDRHSIGRLIGALDDACASEALAATGGVLWLRPRDR
jgi:hypothetical protein